MNEKKKVVKVIKTVSFVLTILSLLFYIYMVIDFAFSDTYYDFELDKQTTPPLSMIFTYSFGSLLKVFIIPLIAWFVYLCLLFYRDVIKKLIDVKKKITIKRTNFSNKKTISYPQSFLQFTSFSNVWQYIKNMNVRVKNIIFVVWILFHIFLLLSFDSNVGFREVQYTWKDFWFFNNWKTEIGFKFDHYYDISEFTIYAILPTLFLFGKRYLSGNLFINKKGISDENDSNLNFDTKINQLKKIKELYDLGVITEMEFEDLKKKLLNR